MLEKFLNFTIVQPRRNAWYWTKLDGKETDDFGCGLDRASSNGGSPFPTFGVDPADEIKVSSSIGNWLLHS